jgi:hypothetical protein
MVTDFLKIYVPIFDKKNSREIKHVISSEAR